MTACQDAVCLSLFTYLPVDTDSSFSNHSRKSLPCWAAFICVTTSAEGEGECNRVSTDVSRVVSSAVSKMTSATLVYEAEEPVAESGLSYVFG